MPPIAGITRVRNESKIIEGTLNHYAKICNAGIYVLDEASTDGTAQLCALHPAVEGLIRLSQFEHRPTERRRFEGWGRELPFRLAQAQINDPALWVVCFDADERLYWDVDNFDFERYQAAQFRLWDYYITPDDEHLSAWEMTERQWIGPEFREIVMAAWSGVIIGWHNRPPTLAGASACVHPDAGDVKHYGKAVSVEEHEATVEYYCRFQPEAFRAKWEARRGKAVKKDFTSDFYYTDLCTWDQRRQIGYPLVDSSM